MSFSDKIFSFTVAYDEYGSVFADDQMSMKVETVVKVHESQKSYSDFKEFQVFNDENAVSVKVRSKFILIILIFFTSSHPTNAK